MVSTKFRKKIEHLLSLADVRINGDRPWDIQVNNEKLYPRILAHGSLGLGEAYMDGWWDCDMPDEFMFKILKANLDNKVNPRMEWLSYIKARIFNLQKPASCFMDCQH
ncbi:MAG: cyclopropane-fatty-acyl-phospholipid synthase, partial [Desulfobacterales bacterium]